MSKSAVAVALGCLILASPTAVVAEPPIERTDAVGDGLPADAVFRLGSIRLRHPDRIDALAFSADGRLLASADSWGFVRIWDAKTGKMRLELPRGTGANVVFSPNGKLLATGSDQMPVRIWDATDGKEIRTLQGPNSPPTGRMYAARSLAFSPDSKMLLGDDGKTTVVLFEVESGWELRRRGKRVGGAKGSGV